MKKILIIGCKGMAGHLLLEYFKNNPDYLTYGLARNIGQNDNLLNLDVSNTEELEQIIVGHQFSIIVNCIGILNKDAEDNPDKAVWFNSYFPHFLERVTKNMYTKIVHISTDCVFSGKRGGYTERDFKDGIGFYAQSKALGEIDNVKDLTIRTSIIGPELNLNGIGLFHWFMSQDLTGELKGYSQAFWSGITTLELAKVVEQAIDQQLCGLIQVSAKSKIDKFALLQLFNKIFRLNDMKVLPFDGYHVDKSLRSIRTDFQYEVPAYEEMLNEMKGWMSRHQEMYSHYTIL